MFVVGYSRTINGYIMIIYWAVAGYTTARTWTLHS